MSELKQQPETEMVKDPARRELLSNVGGLGKYLAPALLVVLTQHEKAMASPI